jgi:dimeric dUTPase (all-alpha-NTP-PPase superfamily)
MNTINPDNSCAHLIKNYDYRSDALQFMFSMQRQLQEFIASKKGGIAPGKGDFRDEIDLAIYYFGCTTTEFFEFGERLNDFDWDLETIDPDEMLEIQYEYIDMWHFIMNQFLYSGITELDLEVTLKSIVDGKQSNVSATYKQSDLLGSTERFWGSFSYTWGKYLNNLPYKKWKKYDDDAMSKVDKTEQLTLANLMIYNFVKFGTLIGIDAEHFYNLYVSKNEENIARQQEGGVYYSG